MCSMRSIRRDASRVLLWSEKDISRFHGDIFAPKNGWFREKHKIRTIKFLFASSSSTLCLLLSFPHYSKCFFVVLLVALQFYYPSEKEATRVIPFCRALLRGKRREGSRESCTSKVYISEWNDWLARVKRKFRLNHIMGHLTRFFLPVSVLFTCVLILQRPLPVVHSRSVPKTTTMTTRSDHLDYDFSEAVRLASLKYSSTNWQSDSENYAKFSPVNLVFPGTHDSGSYYLTSKFQPDSGGRGVPEWLQSISLRAWGNKLFSIFYRCSSSCTIPIY